MKIAMLLIGLLLGGCVSFCIIFKGGLKSVQPLTE